MRVEEGLNFVTVPELAFDAQPQEGPLPLELVGNSIDFNDNDAVTELPGKFLMTTENGIHIGRALNGESEPVWTPSIEGVCAKLRWEA